MTNKFSFIDYNIPKSIIYYTVKDHFSLKKMAVINFQEVKKKNSKIKFTSIYNIRQFAGNLENMHGEMFSLVTLRKSSYITQKNIRK